MSDNQLAIYLKINDDKYKPIYDVHLFEHNNQFNVMNSDVISLWIHHGGYGMNSISVYRDDIKVLEFILNTGRSVTIDNKRAFFHLEHEDHDFTYSEHIIQLQNSIFVKGGNYKIKSIKMETEFVVDFCLV